MVLKLKNLIKDNSRKYKYRSLFSIPFKIKKLTLFRYKIPTRSMILLKFKNSQFFPGLQSLASSNMPS